ncbi:MAG TPA: outer membrane beta-barrel protein [Nitrospira sp.]|nr:outer membrane beta-barrel protein [Nitrospira sp.]
MNKRRRGTAVGLAWALCSLIFIAVPARAENYVAGQLGMTFPQALSSGTVTQDGLGGLEISDQPLKNSIMLGGKLGHYFTRARWIGVETGISYANPHIKEGSLTFSGSGGPPVSTGTLAGVHQRMIIWDVATLMFRYPGYRLQPYIGVGPSLFFATLKGPTAPPGQSGTAIGLNVEGGARYYMTRRWALFGELQYHRARIGYTSNDSNSAADPFGFRATYSAVTASIGVSYHF